MVLYCIAAGFAGFLLLMVAVLSEVFASPYTWVVAALTFGVGFAGMVLSGLSRERRTGVVSGYVALCFTGTAVIIYLLSYGGAMQNAVMLAGLCALFASAVYVKWGYGFWDDFWIVLMSSAGFWIIVQKFTWQIGFMAIFFGIVTAVLIFTLSYLVIEEG